MAIALAIFAVGGCKSDEKPAAKPAPESALDPEVNPEIGPSASAAEADASSGVDATADEQRVRPETRPPPPSVAKAPTPDGEAPAPGGVAPDDADPTAVAPGIARPAPPSVAPRNGLVPRGPRAGADVGAAGRGVHPARLGGDGAQVRPGPIPRKDAPEEGGGEADGEPAAEEAAPTAPTAREPGEPAPALRGPGEPARAAAPSPPTAPPSRSVATPLDIERYLPLERVRDIVTERRVMPSGPLAGLEPGPAYNSRVFSVPGKDGFGVAVQVWQDSSRRDVNERFERMRAQSPNASEIQTLEPTKAFYSWFSQIQSLTFFDTNKLVVVSVSCGEAVCSQQALLQLAQLALAGM